MTVITLMSNLPKLLQLIKLNDAVSKQYDTSFLDPAFDKDCRFRFPDSDSKRLQTRFPRLTNQILESLAMLQYAWVPPYSFLRPNEILESLDRQIASYPGLAKMFDETMQWDDQIPGNSGSLGFCKCTSAWNTNWMPIANFLDEEVLFVDMDPGPNGVFGQLVHAYDDEMGPGILCRRLAG